jgi:hypothetical protein
MGESSAALLFDESSPLILPSKRSLVPLINFPLIPRRLHRKSVGDYMFPVGFPCDLSRYERRKKFGRDFWERISSEFLII